jgi:hypothetical protein
MKNDASEHERNNCIVIGVEYQKNHWVSGFCGSYRFQAKVYDKGSTHGINGGRVSKLAIQGSIDPDRIKGVASYDRGWDIEPIDEEAFEVFAVILFCLEQLPPEASVNVS